MFVFEVFDFVFKDFRGVCFFASCSFKVFLWFLNLMRFVRFLCVLRFSCVLCF